MDHDFLSDALRENFESYADDIEDENDYDYEYENRLVKECVDAGIITEEEAENEEYDIDELKEKYVDYMCNDWEGKEADYFIDNFGSLDEAFGRDNVESNLDLNAMAEWAVEEDGVAHFIARYDGVENEHEYDGTTYWIYRTN
jgi:chromosome condensin MukBEF ATPase and DNA-binding subunit MukB